MYTIIIKAAMIISLLLVSGGYDDFVNKAIQESLLQIDMGKLAQSNSGSEAMKSYGMLLEQDHSTLQRQLVSIAREEAMPVVVALDAAYVQKIAQLKELRGVKFDSLFLLVNIPDLERSLALYRMAAQTHTHQKIRQLATDGYGVIENDLGRARELQVQKR